MSKKGRHKTVARDLKRAVEWLESLDEVKRVIIGISECCRHRYAPGTLRVRLRVQGGLSLNGYSGKGVTDFYVNIDPPDRIAAIQAMIENRYGT